MGKWRTPQEKIALIGEYNANCLVINNLMKKLDKSFRQFTMLKDEIKALKSRNTAIRAYIKRDLEYGKDKLVNSVSFAKYNDKMCNLQPEQVREYMRVAQQKHRNSVKGGMNGND